MVEDRGEVGLIGLQKFTDLLVEKGNKEAGLSGLFTVYKANSPQLFVDVDRDACQKHGLNLSDVFGTLQGYLGSRYVNDFNRFGRTWQVLMSAEPQYRKQPDAIGDIYVRSDKGEMIPLRTLAKVSFTAGPDSLDRFNNLPAVKIFGQGAPGVSSGQAIAAVEKLAKEVLPADFSFDWGGASFQEKKSSGTSGLALGLAAIMVFLILAAQYERWSLPFAVLLSVPFAVLGALVAVLMRGMSNDIYFQIGLVTLIGLAANNAILIVEFAAQKQAEGMSALDAAVEAARLRFRPIVMTSLAFVLGVAVTQS